MTEYIINTLMFLFFSSTPSASMWEPASHVHTLGMEGRMQEQPNMDAGQL